MRYVVVRPTGHVLEMLTDEATVATLVQHLDSMVTEEATVFYDAQSSDKYNWQGQRLVRDIVMPEFRVCGDVIVFGVPDTDGHPQDIDPALIVKMKERHAARD